MKTKSFCLVLHSHIPYVLGHGSRPHGMDRLFEAAAESCLPLLQVFLRLRDEGRPSRVNVSFTPVLMEQLKSPSFAAGFKSYLRMKVEIAQKDRAYFEKTGNRPLQELTTYWEDWYIRLLETWEEEDQLFSEVVSPDGNLS